MIEIIPRSAWTTRSVSLPGIDCPTPNSWLHHLAGALSPDASFAELCQVLRNAEAFHIGSRGYSAIGYSFAVSLSGRVFEGRGACKYGAHTGNLGQNRVSHGIVWMGNFDVQQPSMAMVEATRQLLARLEADGVLLPSNIHPTGGHRDVGSYFGGGTACPGKFAYPYIPILRSHKEVDEVDDDERRWLMQAAAAGQGVAKAKNKPLTVAGITEAMRLHAKDVEKIAAAVGSGEDGPGGTD